MNESPINDEADQPTTRPVVADSASDSPTTADTAPETADSDTADSPDVEEPDQQLDSVGATESVEASVPEESEPSEESATVESVAEESESAVESDAEESELAESESAEESELAESESAEESELAESELTESARVAAEDAESVNALDDGESAEGTAAEEPAAEESTGAESTREDAALPALDVRAALEAVLLVVDEPVADEMLAQVLERPVHVVRNALEDLAAEYNGYRRGMDLRRIAGGWRLYTREDFSVYVERFVLDGQQARLTQAALETLAVVAYKQPVSRSRISAIRGVGVDGVMRTLITRGLIEECGAESDSGAHLYRTTTLFLEKMGLNGIEDLPDLAPLLPDVGDLSDLVDEGARG